MKIFSQNKHLHTGVPTLNKMLENYKTKCLAALNPSHYGIFFILKKDKEMEAKNRACNLVPPIGKVCVIEQCS